MVVRLLVGMVVGFGCGVLLAGAWATTGDFLNINGYFGVKGKLVSGLGACGSGQIGGQATVTDSSVNTWGTNVANGGTSVVEVFCNGTNWTVTGK